MFKNIQHPESAHLLRKEKFTVQFDWFGFDQTCKCLSNSTQAKQLNPSQSNRRSAVQWLSTPPPDIFSITKLSLLFLISPTLALGIKMSVDELSSDEMTCSETVKSDARFAELNEFAS